MSANMKTVETESLIRASDLSPAEVSILRTTIAKDLTDAELALFLRVSQMRGLNPMAGQIHAIKRRDGDNGSKMTMQVAIDGFRLIAHRTGEHAGTDDVAYEEQEGLDHPVKATVTVWRIVQGQRVAFTASARWKEYVPTDKQAWMWRKMPYLMLGKVCEALALRKAFAQELSGLYEPSEMDQAENEFQPEPERKPVKQIKSKVNYQEWKASPELVDALIATARDAKAAGVTGEEMSGIMPEGVTQMKQLSNAQVSEYLEKVSELIQVAREAQAEGREA